MAREQISLKESAAANAFPRVTSVLPDGDEMVTSETAPVVVHPDTRGYL
jgi:hypothetical protein